MFKNYNIYGEVPVFGGTVYAFKGKRELIYYEFKLGNINTFPDSWKENLFDVIKGK